MGKCTHVGKCLISRWRLTWRVNCRSQSTHLCLVELWNSLSKMKIYLVSHSKLSLKRNHLTGFVGLSTASRGFSCRQALVNHDESIQQLRNYLCTPTGMRRDLKSPYIVNKKPLEVPKEYSVPYKERIPSLYQTFQSYIDWVSPLLIVSICQVQTCCILEIWRQTPLS